jgi:hypothetical protein
MKIRLPIIALCMSSVAHAQEATESWRLRTLPAPSETARPLLLQADGDVAPEWGAFDGETITVSDIATNYPPVTYTVPKDTNLFDLRDTDRDGKPEIALLRAGRLEYWANAAAIADQNAPTVTLEDPALASLSFGAPRPYPLFVERRGEDFLSVPLGAEPPLWTLEGTRINPLAPSAADSLRLGQFHIWAAATPPGASPSRTEFRLSQVYEVPAPVSQPSVNARPGGTRRARDAGDSPSAEWPSFALTDSVRVLYALAPPDYRDTLIRIEWTGLRVQSEPQSSPRRFPGILIAPQDSTGDFNADGYADLLLWRAPGPGTSMDALVRAAQSGTWNVTLTVHLYEPASRRFAARPIEWFQAAAPLAHVLEGGVRGPFSFLKLEDLDGDRRTEMVNTGAGNELVAWRFTGARAAGPWLYAKLDQPVDDVILTARVPAYRWLGIDRSGDQFHLFALPQN